MRTILRASIVVWAVALAGPIAAQPPVAQPPAAAEAGATVALPATQRIAFLGTATLGATDEQRAAAGLPAGLGLVVQHVLRASPADVAGLERGDVLHKLDDQLLVNDPQFRTLLRLRRPGDEVRLTAFRDGQPREFRIRLGEREVPAGDVPAGELLHWLLKPDASDSAVATAGFSARYEDDEHVLQLSIGDDGKHLLVQDKQGASLFDGTINTPAERQLVPAALRGKLAQLETPPAAKPSPAAAPGAH
jgi:hypothetical protein